MSDEDIDKGRRLFTKSIGALMATPILESHLLVGLFKDFGVSSDKVIPMFAKLNEVTESNFSFNDRLSYNLVDDLVRLQIYATRFNANPLDETQWLGEHSQEKKSTIIPSKAMFVVFPVLKEVAPEKRMEAAIICVAEFRKAVVEYAAENGKNSREFVVENGAFHLFREISDEEYDAISNAVLQPYVNVNRPVRESGATRSEHIGQSHSEAPAQISLPLPNVLKVLTTPMIIETQTPSPQLEYIAEQPQLEVDTENAELEEPFCGPPEPAGLRP